MTIAAHALGIVMIFRGLQRSGQLFRSVTNAYSTSDGSRRRVHRHGEIGSRPVTRLGRCLVGAQVGRVVKTSGKLPVTFRCRRIPQCAASAVRSDMATANPDHLDLLRALPPLNTNNEPPHPRLHPRPPLNLAGARETHARDGDARHHSRPLSCLYLPAAVGLLLGGVRPTARRFPTPLRA